MKQFNPITMKRTLPILALFIFLTSCLQGQVCPTIYNYSTLGSILSINHGSGSAINSTALGNCVMELGYRRENFIKFISPANGYYKLSLSNTVQQEHQVVVAIRTTNNTCNFLGFNLICPISSPIEQAYLLGPLNAGTTYDILLQGTIYAPQGGVSDVIINCAPPSAITSNVSPHSAVISFTCTCPTNALIQYRAVGTSTYSTVTGLSPITINNLQDNTDYELYIKSACGNGYSDSVFYKFRTTIDCANATSITCGTPFTYSHVNGDYSGFWSNYGCGPTNTSTEKVLRFTPTQSGTYMLNCTQNFGWQANAYAYIKAASGICDASGWTCIGSFGTVSSLSMGALTAGTTYLVLLDTYGAMQWYTKTFTIGCIGACAANVTPTGSVAHCGNGITLSVNPTAGATYQWYSANNPIQGATSTSYLVPATGDYYCVKTSSCGSVTSNAAEVYNLQANAPYLLYEQVLNLCYFTSLRLIGQPFTNVTYQWKRNGVVIPGATSPEYYATQGGIYNYTVTMPCGSFVSSASLTVADPSIVSISSTSTSICNGGVISLTATPASNVSGAYQWKKNGVIISGAVSSAYSASTSGSYTCLFTPNNCSTGVSSESNAIVITVSSGNPPATPGTITGLAKACPGSNGIIYSINPVTNATIYNWTVPANASIASGQGTTSIAVNFSSSFVNGTIGVTAGNACGTSNVRNKSVSRNIPGTPAAITGQTFNLCNGATAQYTIPATANATTYLWTPPAGAVINTGQGTTSASITFPASFTTGTLSVKAGTTCGYGSARNLSVKGTPAVPATITGPASACANQSGVNYNTTSVMGATAYNWSVPSGATITTGQGTTGITMKFGVNAGNVRVRAQNGCGYSAYKSLPVAITCREAIEEQNPESINIYPNPSSNYFTVSCPSNEKFELIVKDLLGRVIHHYYSPSSNFDFGYDLQDGIYLAEVILESEHMALKIIKRTGFTK